MADWTAVERCRKPTGWGKRHLLALLGFCGFALSYAMRFSLSIAIVAMVNHTALASHKSQNSSIHIIVFKSDICPNVVTHIEDTHMPQGIGNDPNSTISELMETPPETNLANEDQGEFMWSEGDQGVILGSFFWGYVLTQCLGGWLSQRIGGKWPFGVGLLITAFFSIVTPFAAKYGGMSWVIFVRIVQGLAGGVTVPSMQAIIAQWFPPEERGKLGSFAFAGMPFGTAISMLCSGYLIHFLGWPSVFYTTGVLTVLWFLFWSFYSHASPFDDPTIDESEFRYILSSLRQCNSSSRQQAQDTQVPWTRVLLSLPFWAILVCNTCETWGLYTIMTELPTYMKTVLHFDIKQNSVMSAFPHLLTLIVSLVLTNLGDSLIERNYLSIGTVRKLCTSIAMWGSAATLLGVAYSGCDRVTTIALLGMAVASLGGKFGGFLVNIIDIAPNYAGILMGVINTVASLPGFFAPWVAGMIINDDPSLENWRLVFLITSAIAFCGNVVYILFASGKEQSWNRRGGGDDTKAHVQNCGDEAPAMMPQGISKALPAGEMGQNNKEFENRNVYIIPPVGVVEGNQHPQPLAVPIIYEVNLRGMQNLDEEKNGLRCCA